MTQNRGTLKIIREKDHTNIFELRAAKYAISTFTLLYATAKPFIKNRQNCCPFLFGQNGRYYKSITHIDQQGNLAIFTGQGDQIYRRVPPRSPQKGG